MWNVDPGGFGFTVYIATKLQTDSKCTRNVEEK